MFLFITEEVKAIYNQLKELPQKALQGKNFQKMFNDVDLALKDNDYSLAWIVTKQLNEIAGEIISPYLAASFG